MEHLDYTTNMNYPQGNIIHTEERIQPNDQHRIFESIPQQQPQWHRLLTYGVLGLLGPLVLALSINIARPPYRAPGQYQDPIAITQNQTHENGTRSYSATHITGLPEKSDANDIVKSYLGHQSRMTENTYSQQTKRQELEYNHRERTEENKYKRENKEEKKSIDRKIDYKGMSRTERELYDMHRQFNRR